MVDNKKITSVHAIGERLSPHSNRIVVRSCPFRTGTHYHGDGTYDGTGTISGNRLADCGNGQYTLMEI